MCVCPKQSFIRAVDFWRRRVTTTRGASTISCRRKKSCIRRDTRSPLWTFRFNATDRWLPLGNYRRFSFQFHVDISVFFRLQWPRRLWAFVGLEDGQVRDVYGGSFEDYLVAGFQSQWVGNDMKWNFVSMSVCYFLIKKVSFSNGFWGSYVQNLGPKAE